MKKIKYIAFVCLAFILLGCAKDKGNYEYTKINDLSISKVESRYSIVVGDKLKITPVFTRNITQTEDNLAFSWIIMDKEIATTRDLDFTIPNSLGFGVKVCRYIVTDMNTDMKYFADFSLEVLNPFNWGYYFLTEKADNSTELGFLSVLDKEKGFAYADGSGQVPFGNKPIMISGAGGNVTIEGETTYCFKLSIMTKEGEYPVVETETATFYPSSTISDVRFFDNFDGNTFSPSGVVTMRSSQISHYISNGKDVAFTSGFLYYPAKHKGDYYWSNPIQCYSGANMAYVFDENSKKYYVIKSDITDAAAGVYSDANRYNRVVPIDNFPSLAGQTIIAVDAGPGTAYNQPTVITVANGALNVVTFGFYAHAAYGTPEFEKGELISQNIIPLAGASAQTRAIAGTNDWFFSVGNKIYIAPKTKLSEIKLFSTLPDKYGEIASIQLSVNKTKLVVATYNAASSADRKGSVVFVNTSTGDLFEDQYPNVINKCVSILSANFYYIYGVKE